MKLPRAQSPAAFGAVWCIVALLAALPSASIKAAAQAPATATVPVAAVPLVAWIASRPHAMPGTLANFETDPNRDTQFRALLDSIISRNWPRALTQAMAINYQLVAIRDGGTFIVASDDSTARDPTVVINISPRRDFIVQAPHTPFEPGTAEEAAILLRDLGGRAAIISGAHRCASRAFTTCDGTTEVCSGTLEGYRDSDAGHNVNTLFHTAHVLLAERWPSSIVMSLHGMKEDNEGVRTSVIISNGIRADDPAQQTVATRFRMALGRSIKQPGAVVSCNLPPDASFQFRKLCGFTNVQGRQVNGDTDACRGSVDQGTGRFIHMEQDWTVLQPYSQGWLRIDRHIYNSAIIGALAQVLPPVRNSR
jgi:hypothetical protein